jgi:hypothetical protein
MAALDRVRTLQQQGQNDSSIAQTLQEEGIPPREINDALAQSRIKNAVSQGNMQPRMNQNTQQRTMEMEPSMMDSSPNIPTPNDVQPMPQEGPYAQEYQGQDFYDPNQSQEYQEPYPNQGYADQGYGGEQTYSSNETVTEIASQIINEEMKETKKTLNDLKETKILLAAKVEKIDQRLERIEKIIDSLQTILLRKATEQEQNIGDIKSEMMQMQEGFSKILNPLFDIERSLEKPKRKTTKRKTKKKK